ncbi:MAG: hypothetical protein ACXVCO_03530 [Ktedonobacterales bacterium]
MKYTFLSKWTVLILTILTFGLSYGGTVLINQGKGFLGVLTLLVALLIYAFAWIIALVDSIQERKYLWSVGLFVLLPFGIGPIVYSLIGPKNTR